MTWLWRICFSAALAYGAEVNGTVVLRDSKEKAVQRGRDYSGVVVWLEPLNGKAPPGTGARATMLQKDKKFIPHVLAIQAGTTVDFPNKDPIFHNAFSNYSGQVFDIGLYSPGSSRAVPFTRPGVVRVFCNIHPNMSAVIVVSPSPWFAKTGADGVVRIPNVPAGEYKLRVFHERATEAALGKLERTLRVAEPGLELPPIAISESGYLPAHHLDKHGKPYPPESESYKVLR